MTRRIRRGSVAAIATVAALTTLAVIGRVSAHKTVVSRFTYYGEVRPILQAKCGHCHVDGGVARTLLTYDGAASFPWGIQQELLSKRMPPFAAEAGLAPLKGHVALTSEEWDTLMTWAAGGVPEGPPAPLVASPPIEWPLGAPDLVLPMAAPVTLAEGQSHQDHDTVLAVPAAAARLIRVVDLSPGARAIVRRAEMSIRDAAGREQVVGLWLPGETPQGLEGGAFEWPAGASLRLRIHYARPSHVRGAIVDRTRVGLYFAPPSARHVQAIVIGDDAPIAADAPRNVTHTFERSMRLLALRPIDGPVDAVMRVIAIGRSGDRTPLMQITLRPDWPRRYVLQTPVTLAARSQIAVEISAPRGGLFQSLFGDRPRLDHEAGALRLALEVVP